MKILMLLTLFSSFIVAQEQMYWEIINSPIQSTSISDIFVSNGNKPYIKDYDEVYTSDDYGDTWYTIEMLPYVWDFRYITEGISGDIYIVSKHHVTIYSETSQGSSSVNTPYENTGSTMLEGCSDTIITVEKNSNIFNYSTNSGNTWNELVTPFYSKYIFYFDGALYIFDTYGVLKRFNAYNETFETIADFQDQPSGKIHKSASGIYYELGTSVLYTENGGESWTTIELPGKNGFQVDKNDLFFRIVEGEYYHSENSGADWVHTNISNFNAPNEYNLYQDLKFYNCYGLRRYNRIDPYIPEDTHFINLHVGNLWLYLYSSNGNYSNSKYTYKVSVIGDTLIDDKQYFLFDSNRNPQRYDSTSRKLYSYNDDAEHLIMDFSIPSGRLAELQDGSGHTVSAMINEEVDEYFGEVRKKGFIGYSNSFMWEYYGEHLGLVNEQEQYGMPFSTSYSRLLESRVYDSVTGEFVTKSKGYAPEFTVEDSVSLFNITLKVKVTHPYDYRKSFVQYLDFIYGYTNGTDTVIIDTQKVTEMGNNKVHYFNVTPDPDFPYQNYDLCYKFATKDNGLVETIFYYPETGYEVITGQSILNLNEENFQEMQIKSYSLSQNYPNPFNPVTKISYSLKKAGHTELIIYDVLANKVATLVNGYKPAGTHEVTFNAANLPSGVYIYRFKAGNFSQSRKMIFLK